MKTLSETTALGALAAVRDRFRSAVSKYEHKALSCSECKTQGACCLDEHFVNVRISRLEAIAIKNALDQLSEERQEEVLRKIFEAVQKYELSEASDRTYACPLYDRSAGCLVHNLAKPLPCIHHACYEKKADLPPDDLLDEAELAVERLNRKVYGKQQALLPLPLALRKSVRPALNDQRHCST